MVIFHGYVSLPEGSTGLFVKKEQLRGISQWPWFNLQNRPLWECANCSISCAKIQQHMAQPDKIEFHSSLLFIG
jgi:hypothetical protein